MNHMVQPTRKCYTLTEVEVGARTTELSSKVEYRATQTETRQAVKRCDGLLSILFNCASVKVVREWEKERSKKGLLQQIHIGGSKDCVMISCPALAILSIHIATAIENS